MTISKDVTTAILCARIAGQLYENDWFINLSRGGVFVTAEFFHKTFNTWYVEESVVFDEAFHCHNVDGVKVYCLVEKEDGHV